MKMNISALHEQFCEERLHIKNFSPATIRWYKVCLGAYLKYWKGEIAVVEQITTESLRKFLYYGLLERKWSPENFIYHHKAIKSFLKWCVGRGYLKENPIAVIEKPKLDKKLPKRITRQDAIRVLEYTFNMRYAYRFEAYRNRGIFAVIIYAGLRAKEVLDLKVSDVDFENNLITVEKGKGGKGRVVPISSALKRYLEEYWKDRERLDKDSIYFFTGLRGDGIFNYRGLSRVVEKVSKRTGIKFSCHRLRHTFATLMLEGGCDLFTLSKMLGHSDIKTTTIYLSASVSHMREQILKHPLNT